MTVLLMLRSLAVVLRHSSILVEINSGNAYYYYILNCYPDFQLFCMVMQRGLILGGGNQFLNLSKVDNRRPTLQK
jgi:hypothetical protein